MVERDTAQVACIAMRTQAKMLLLMLQKGLLQREEAAPIYFDIRTVLFAWSSSFPEGWEMSAEVISSLDELLRDRPHSPGR